MPPMHTLLLADDSVAVQRVLDRTFAGQPFEVIVARDGQDAIDRMATIRPDLVLADTNMPCVDGYGVAEWVGRQPRLAGVPVLLLASALDPVDEQRYLKSGAAGVLEQPFEPTHVIDRVKELLGLSGTADNDGSRLVTPPIKVIRPPDKAEPPDTSGSGAGAALQVADQPPSADDQTSAEGEQVPAGAASAPQAVSSRPDDPGPGDARPADVFEALLAEEQGTTGETAPPAAGAAPIDAGPPPGGADAGANMSDETVNALAARLEARLTDSVAAEVASAMQALKPAMEQAVREAVSAALPAAVSQATDTVRQDVQAVVTSAVSSAVPAAVAEATAGALGDSVRAIVLETSERLVKAEIARVRGTSATHR